MNSGTSYSKPNPSGTKKTLLLSVPRDISTLGSWTGTENARFWRAASLENTRQKVAEEVSVARSQMLSLEPELSISGDEKAQMRHELLAEMAQERQQQEEKALCIQRSWARGVSRSNERDQDMER
nr:hypothetical protein [Shigella sonnei]